MTLEPDQATFFILHPSRRKKKNSQHKITTLRAHSSSGRVDRIPATTAFPAALVAAFFPTSAASDPAIDKRFARGIAGEFGSLNIFTTG